LSGEAGGFPFLLARFVRLSSRKKSKKRGMSQFTYFLNIDMMMTKDKRIGQMENEQSFLDTKVRISQSKEMINLKTAIEESKEFYSLGKLLGNLVHEINNPLDGILRYVNLAFDCLENESEGIVKEYLGEAKVGLNRLTTIVRSILDFSWSLSPQQGQIDINQAIEESLLMFNRYILSYNIEVKKFLFPHLPKFPNYGLKLVFNNLIKNACEAMEKGGMLTVCTSINNGVVEIIFKDTGDGIPFDLQNKIFEPFFTTKDMGKGSGLGLAISYEIIQRYKGTIQLDSQPEQGATFIIHLPVNDKT